MALVIYNMYEGVEPPSPLAQAIVDTLKHLNNLYGRGDVVEVGLTKDGRGDYFVRRTQYEEYSLDFSFAERDGKHWVKALGKTYRAKTHEERNRL